MLLKYFLSTTDCSLCFPKDKFEFDVVTLLTLYENGLTLLYELLEFSELNLSDCAICDELRCFNLEVTSHVFLLVCPEIIVKTYASPLAIFKLLDLRHMLHTCAIILYDMQKICVGKSILIVSL